MEGHPAPACSTLVLLTGSPQHQLVSSRGCTTALSLHWNGNLLITGIIFPPPLPSHIVSPLSPPPRQLNKEKVDLEVRLEAEQEYVVNKLRKQVRGRGRGGQEGGCVVGGPQQLPAAAAVGGPMPWQTSNT